MVNWKAFEAKYDNREQWAFENMSYFLFCSEMEYHNGIFRYFNQTGIETEPIEKDGKYFGFQAKYSKNKQAIIDSIKKAKNKNSNLTNIYVFVGKEFSESPVKNQKKPKYQIEIEEVAKSLKIEIKWCVRSNLEYQLSQTNNKWILDIFFGNDGLDPDFFENQIEKEVKNLGTRFNEKLNFELPIAQIFNSVSKNRIFHQNIIRKTDKWLTEKRYRILKNNELLAEIETELETLRLKLKDWLIEFHNYTVESEIGLSPFIEKVRSLNTKVSDKTHEIFDVRSQHTDEKGKTKRSFDEELGRLREIQNVNLEFLDKIDNLNINLANHPTLIIKGEAGCGKSHLLGDIATQRKNHGLPTVLLLGTTFTHNTTIERNILDKLDLTYPFKDFLENLNSVGLSTNSRALILVDAINEGAGVDLWKNQIAGFINVVAKYPAVGLVLTIRSTYYNDIIPDSFETNPIITINTHEGFKGNEYEALKLFCKHYELKLPNFPILNPEYSNPLFLHTICEGVRSLPDKTFPKGFYGINKTYNLYKSSLNKKFEEKRPEYKYQDIVSKAIKKMAVAIFDSEYHSINITEAVDLFNAEFSRFRFLLSDLIEESVLIKTRNKYYKENPKDIVFFSYQRLGDFFMAEELLKLYNTKEELKNAFTNDKRFQKITQEFQWSSGGVIEAFSILLPERYNFELFELIDFFFEKNADERNKEWQMMNTYESFTRILLDSLKWRELSSINEKKITKWLKKDGRISNDEWFYLLTEFTSITDHPFNSDRLHKILLQYSMSECDGFLQNYFRGYSNYDDNNFAFPLRCLIDWAWTPNISFNTDKETARLVAQTLAWVLSSTDIALRDQTTKALVNLLEQQPEVLVLILKAFEEINDLYISERLFAVAYGCILRTEKETSIKIIAHHIYNTVFKDKNPPANILLRDYARNAVEYASYKNVGLEVDLNLIRPPYNTPMPILPQSEDDVKEYKLDYESPDYKKNHGSQQNAIYSSVISGISDFGRYIVDSAVSHFASYSFREDEICNNFLKSLKKEPRDFVKLLYDSTNDLKDFNERTAYQKQIGLNYSKDLQKYSSMLEELKSTCLIKLKAILDEEQLIFLENTIIPYFNRKLNIEHKNDWSIRYWIVKRVFELGYNKELHGEYDSFVSDFYYARHGNKVERIGKKYQWIAFYEIMAILADNYKINDGWSSSKKYDYYKGSWQFSIRNIDPAYITKNNNNDEIDVATSKEWWKDEEYSQWSYQDSEWVKTVDDLIDPKTVIEKKDANNEEWLHLQYFVEWNEPKRIGIDRYEGRRKQIFYLIQGLLVKKSDKKKTINYLKNQIFWGRWLPENRDDYSKLINREKFWSPAYIDTYKKDRRIWETIQDTKLKVIVTTESANGGIENDKSGANQSYNIPCKYIFKKMNLQYAPIDGNLTNLYNEIITMNSNPSGVLIRKKEFVKFLKDNNLDIIWTLLGEKLSFDNNRNEDSYFKVPCGVYYIEDSQIKGEVKMYDRN